jgi:hypothetical protein
MTWDPEIDDPLEARRRLAAQAEIDAAADPADGGLIQADGGSGVPEAAPVDLLAPIDPNAPVSGHRPPPAESTPASASPEHDWTLARTRILPALRPVGTQGLAVGNVDPAMLSEAGATSHTQPLVDDGPCGVVVVYAMAAAGFDVLVNGDHLLGWGVAPGDVRDAALANLAAWSAGASWTSEESGGRRLLSSDSGDGQDAARILLPEVRARLAGELGVDGARVLVGLPERHLLVGGSLRAGDDEFAALFADFVVEHSGGADEPIDRRVFELVDGGLVEFAG